MRNMSIQGRDWKRTDGRKKLTVEQVKEIKMLFKTALTNKEIGERFGVTEQAISLIRKNINWKNV